MSGSDYLDPLPKDFTLAAASANAANALGLDTVQAIIDRLDRARAQLAAGQPADQLLPLSTFVKTGNAKVATSHKEWASAVNKFGKGVDKKFATPLVPVFPPPNTVEPPSGLHPSLLTITAAGATSSIPPPPSATFGSPLALSALNETIALHLARLGSFGALDTFLAESGTPSPSEGLLADLRLLHSILAELQNGSCTSALDWVTSNASLGVDPKGDLEFALRKDEFVRLLLSSSDLSSSTDPLLPTPSTSYASPSTQAALAYGGHHFRPFHTPAREATIQALFTAPLYMPFSRLLASPYAALFEEYDEGEGGKGGGTTGLMGMFTGAFLRRVGLQRDSPLSVVTDIGGGGAMARIQKVRAVMKEKRTEWSAVDELPVEIPLPASHSYHSIFACPVSKEQSTAANPPMLLPCGHVIAKESLVRLARGTPSFKCPYCPAVDRMDKAMRVYF